MRLQDTKASAIVVVNGKWQPMMLTHLCQGHTGFSPLDLNPELLGHMVQGSCHKIDKIYQQTCCDSRVPSKAVACSQN